MTTTELDFDPDVLRAKYREERDKRRHDPKRRVHLMLSLTRMASGCLLPRRIPASLTRG